jgi:hypothetical protein
MAAGSAGVLGGRGDELVGDPLGDAGGVGRWQSEDDVLEAGADRLADRVLGGAGLVVGDRQVDRAGDRGGVAADLGAVSVQQCAQLLGAAATAGEIRPGMDAYELLRGVGSLCVGADNDPRYDARRMVELVIAGLRLA